MGTQKIRVVKTYISNNDVYKIPKNYFANNTPCDDLFISGQHKIFVNNKLSRVCDPLDQSYIVSWDQPIYNLRLSIHKAKLMVENVYAKSWRGMAKRRGKYVHR